MSKKRKGYYRLKGNEKSIPMIYDRMCKWFNNTKKPVVIASSKLKIFNINEIAHLDIPSNVLFKESDLNLDNNFPLHKEVAKNTITQKFILKLFNMPVVTEEESHIVNIPSLYPIIKTDISTLLNSKYISIILTDVKRHKLELVNYSNNIGCPTVISVVIKPNMMKINLEVLTSIGKEPQKFSYYIFDINGLINDELWNNYIVFESYRYYLKDNFDKNFVLYSYGKYLYDSILSSLYYSFDYYFRKEVFMRKDINIEKDDIEKGDKVPFHFHYDLLYNERMEIYNNESYDIEGNKIIHDIIHVKTPQEYGIETNGDTVSFIKNICYTTRNHRIISDDIRGVYKNNNCLTITFEVKLEDCYVNDLIEVLSKYKGFNVLGKTIDGFTECSFEEVNIKSITRLYKTLFNRFLIKEGDNDFYILEDSVEEENINDEFDD